MDTNCHHQRKQSAADLTRQGKILITIHVYTQDSTLYSILHRSYCCRFILSQIIWSALILLKVKYNRVFFLYTAILQPSLNPIKSFSRKLSNLNLARKSKFFERQSYSTYLTCASFYTSVSGVIHPTEPIASLK